MVTERTVIQHYPVFISPSRPLYIYILSQLVALTLFSLCSVGSLGRGEGRRQRCRLASWRLAKEKRKEKRAARG